MLAAVCDDEESARVLVGDFLIQKMKKREEPLEVCYFDCGEDLVEQYEEGNRRFDIIFLDVYMKFMDGVETARQIREYDRSVALIFMTFSRDHAMDGYDVWASGYLLKPVDADKLGEVFRHFMEERYPRIRQSLLVIGKNSGKRIAYDDILYIESRRMNLRIVCSHGVEHTIRKKLGEVQEELPADRFLRCNRSFIVNMDYIADADGDFTMENGDRIPIKGREKKQIRKQYLDYMVENG